MPGKYGPAHKPQENDVTTNVDSGYTAKASSSLLAHLFRDARRLFFVQAAAIFAIAFLVFANGIPNDFNIDDIYYTTPQNAIVGKGLKAIPEVFTSHTLHDNSGNNFDYRPLPMVTFILQHYFLSGSPHVSHFINVLLYACICTLVFILLCQWLGSSSSWFAFFVAAIYAVHPLHTEVVDSIKSRDELLASLCGMLTLFFAWKWHKQSKISYIILALLCVSMSIICKQTSIFYLFVLPLIFYFFSDMRIVRIALTYLLLIAPFIVIAIMQKVVYPETAKRVFLAFENPMFVYNIPWSVKTATASYIFGSYSYLHVFPCPLSFYYGYKYVHLLPWENMYAIASAAGLILLIFFALYGLRRKSLISFGISFYLICIIPFINLHTPAPGMMAERFAFASSLGYCIVFVTALCFVFKVSPAHMLEGRKGKFIVVISLLIFTVYAAMSIVRNTQWKDSWTLISHDIKHLEQSAKANMFYGEQLVFKTDRCRKEMMQRSETERAIFRDSILLYQQEAKKAFTRALAVAPGYDFALENLAVIYIDQDSCWIAKPYLWQALSVSPSDPIMHYNMALAHVCLDKQDSALLELKKAIAIYPRYYSAYGELSMIYLKQNDTAAAIRNLLDGVKNAPGYPVLYNQLSSIYLAKRDTAMAIYYSKLAMSVSDSVLFR